VLAGTAIEPAATAALKADGLRPVGVGSLVSAAPGTVVCGWPGLPTAAQRKRARDAVGDLTPHRVVLVTDIGQRGALERLIDDGVRGIVRADALAETIGPTVRSVAVGQLCVPPTRGASRDRRPLSLRQREILALVIMGLTNREIGQRLHLEESTVKSHLVSTFAKLGVRSRAEAVEVVSDPQGMLDTGVLALSTTLEDGESDG
jgi:DNA-binding NarL/FixJ family response regulator